MAIVENITADCGSGTLSRSLISRQWDDKGTLIQFAGYPEPEDAEQLIYRLIVWMKSTEDGDPAEQAPIELEADQWLISNVYTQFPQTIRFQLCITNESGTYEKHSPIFSGNIGRSLSHSGEETDIDVSTLFDPYKRYVDELIVASGAVVIDEDLDTAGAAADAKATGDAVTELNERLTQSAEGLSLTVQRDKADNGKAWGNSSVNFFAYKGQDIKVTNNSGVAIWFGLKDSSGNNIVDSLKINNGASATITIGTVPAYYSIYADTYPINVSIESGSIYNLFDNKVDSLSDDVDDITMNYLEGKKCYVVLSDFDTTENKYYSNDLTPIAPTDGNVYHITPPFEVPAGTYSYNGIDTYWSFYVYKDGTKTRISGAASGTLTLAQSATIYLSTRENLGAYANVNWVSGSTVYYVAPNKGYFSEKIEMLDGITQIMASVGMFTSVAALGDSYTATSVKNTSGTWADYPNQSWIATLCNRSNVTQYNYGVGGATIKSYASTNMFNNNVLGSDPKDLYFICFGINDYQQSLTVGTVADINDSDYTQNADTFCGWYGRVIAQLKTHAPNAKIVLIKPWTSGAAASAYGDAVSAIAEHYSIPCIDPYDDIFFNGGYLVPSINAGHPTLMGYNMMGIAMERLFSECVMNNLSYFKFATVG